MAAVVLVALGGAYLVVGGRGGGGDDLAERHDSVASGQTRGSGKSAKSAKTQRSRRSQQQLAQSPRVDKRLSQMKRENVQRHGSQHSILRDQVNDGMRELDNIRHDNRGNILGIANFGSGSDDRMEMQSNFSRSSIATGVTSATGITRF